MRKNKCFWLVAVVASSLSFIMIISAVIFSNTCQEVFDLNSCVYNKLPPIFLMAYEKLKLVIDLTLSILGNLNFKEIPFEYLPIWIGIGLFVSDLGFTKEPWLFSTTRKLYAPLIEYIHPTRRLKILYWFIRVFFGVSILLFSIGWYSKDYPVIIFALISGISIIVFGVFHKFLYNLWKKRNYKNKES